MIEWREEINLDDPDDVDYLYRYAKEAYRIYLENQELKQSIAQQLRVIVDLLDDESAKINKIHDRLTRQLINAPEELIRAIKLYRDSHPDFGLPMPNLKESKEFVEAFRERLRREGKIS